MLKTYQVNIFVRVIKRKLKEAPEGTTLQEVFDNDYPKLPQEARDQIGLKLNE